MHLVVFIVLYSVAVSVAHLHDERGSADAANRTAVRAVLFASAYAY